MTGLSAAEARLSFDPTTLYCASGCLVTMTSANTVVWINPATAATVKSLTLSTSINTNGDIVVVPTATNNETLYVVETQSLYTINATTGTVTGPVTISGPTGSLTGLAYIPNGHLVACEQIGSGSAWTLWEFTTAGAAVTQPHAASRRAATSSTILRPCPRRSPSRRRARRAAGPGDSMFYTVALKNTGFFAYATAAITDPVPANVVDLVDDAAVVRGDRRNGIVHDLVERRCANRRRDARRTSVPGRPRRSRWSARRTRAAARR